MTLPKALVVLIIDNCEQARNALRNALVSECFTVVQTSTAAGAASIMASRSVDLIIMDLVLAGEDGLAFGRDLRAQCDVPIIIVTAKSDPIDRIVGLEIGVDDYVAKPFIPREVVARAKAILRRLKRREAQSDDRLGRSYVFGDWELCIATRQLINKSERRGSPNLTISEFDLIHVFAERPERVLSRSMLLSLMGGNEAEAFDRSIDTLVARLRKKIEANPAEPKLIKTVRGIGYMFAMSVARR